MKIKKYLRAGERKSVARFREHFGGARWLAGITYRFASLVAPVAVLALVGIVASHASGSFDHNHHSTHFAVMGLTSPVLKNLNKQKVELLNAQEAILNSAESAKRQLTAAEDEEFKKHENAIKDISLQIDRHTAIATERAKLAMATSQPVVPGQAKPKFGSVKLSEEYREAFYRNFSKLGSVRNDLLFEGADADSAEGGVVAPIVFEDSVIPLAPTNMALRQLAFVTPTQNDIKIPCEVTRSTAAVKQQSTTGGTHSFAATNPTIVLKTLSAAMIGNYIPASIESLQDIGYLQSFVQDDISRAVLEAEETSYSGVLLDPTAGATPYTATPVAVASPESFLDVIAAQPTKYDNGSSWLMDKTTGFAIRKAQIDANQFLPYWTREIDPLDGVLRDFFHGYPVRYSSRMKGAKTAGSPPTAHDATCFGNFKLGFIIGDRNNSAILVKVDDITQFGDGIIKVFGYRRSGALVRNQDALRQVTLS